MRAGPGGPARINKSKWTLTQHSTSVTSGTRLFVAGGKPPEEKRAPLVTYYDMQTEKFGQSQPLPAGRCCGSGGFINGTLYQAGGFWDEVDDLVTCKATWGRKIE